MKIEYREIPISELIKLEGALQVDAEYQRGAEWTLKQERLLIDSLFRGYPIPMFYFHRKTIESTLATNTFFFIVDGQQRKNAICRYVNNQFSMFDPAKDKKTGLALFQRDTPIPWAGRKFDALPAEHRDFFMAVKLKAVFVETENPNEIRDLFIRLQAGLPLSSQEKRDAWPGDFTKFIVETAGKQSTNQSWSGHDFFKKVLKGTAARGNMRKLCAAMFMQLYSRRTYKYSPESFTSIGGADIDNFYQYHIDFDTHSMESQAPRFIELLDLAASLLGDGKTPKIEAHMAYNVILLLDLFVGNYAYGWENDFVQAFHAFSKKLSVAKKDKDRQDSYWINYGIIIGQAAGSKSTIQARFRFFEKEMLQLMGNVKRLDPTRAYSPGERELIYYRDEAKCYKCKNGVLWQEAEIDHVIPHIHGGETTLENGKLVCRKCHTRGPAVHQQFEASLSSLASSEEIKPWEEGDEERKKRINRAADGKKLKVTHLYLAGLLPAGSELSIQCAGKSVRAEFQPPDSFVSLGVNAGATYNSFNKMASEVVGSINIWGNTTVKLPSGFMTTLSDLRDQYLGNEYQVEVEENEPELERL